MKKSIIIAIIGILLMASQSFAWDDICDVAKETPYITTVKLKEFYEDKMRNRSFNGKGFVRNVWQHGVNNYYAVKVDCGNDVIVNISTSTDCKDLKVGQKVSFNGTCISFDRRRYVDTQQIYMIFELESGSVR